MNKYENYQVINTALITNENDFNKLPNSLSFQNPDGRFASLNNDLNKNNNNDKSNSKFDSINQIQKFCFIDS